MGAFFKSFWREMGRNTGKRVSNAMYGDKWSTPYRIRGVGGNQSGSGGCLGCLAWPFKLIGYILLFPFLVLYFLYILPIKWLVRRIRG